MSPQGFLLDTHVLLWLDTDPGRLSHNILRQLRDRQRTVYVSAASLWELAIKQSLGKLPRMHSVSNLLERYGLTELTVRALHADVLLDLPLHHHDPFDRMLIAQAIAEQLVLVTADRQMQLYEVAILHC